MKKQHLDALRAIKAANAKKLLVPREIVARASDPSHPLHDRFEWDDSVAADAWRTDQARTLIQQFYTIERATQKPIRVWISLNADRRTGGYRESVDVMNDPQLRAQFLATAIDDLSAWARTYGALLELQPVFDALDDVKRDLDAA